MDQHADMPPYDGDAIHHPELVGDPLGLLKAPAMTFADVVANGERLSRKAMTMMRSTEELLAVGSTLTLLAAARADIFASKPRTLAVIGGESREAGVAWHEWYERVGRNAVAFGEAAERFESALAQWFRAHGVELPDVSIEA